MPVIGRLDGQVDEVIISPISRRPREEELAPTPENEEAPAPSGDTPSQTPPSGESSAEADELPVWLL